MVQRLKSIGVMVLKRIGAPALHMIVGLALLLAAPLLAAPPAPTPHPTMVLQVGHTGTVDVIAYTPNGKTLVTGSFDDGTARLWDLATGQVKAILSADEGTFALSPRGQTLATASYNGVQIWDAGSGQLTVTLSDASGPLAFSPDGQTLATGGDDSSVRLWDPASGQLKVTLPASARTVAFSPDGQTLATGEVGEARLWDVASGKLKAILETGFGGAEDFAFSADGGTLATEAHVEDITYLRFWDVASGKPRMGFDGAEGPFAFAPDGKTLATGGGDGVQLWDVASGQLKATLQANLSVDPLIFSPDGRTLAGAGWDDSGNPALLLFDMASGQMRAFAQGQTDWVASLAFAPDGQTLVTGDAVGTVRLRDVASGKLTAILKGVSTATAAALAPNGRTLATGSDDGVRLWDVASGQLNATLKDAARLLAFSPDGKTLATTDASQVQLWDVASRQIKATLTGKTSQLAFSTDGKMLATRDASSHLHLWDVATGSPISLTAHTSLAQFPPWLTHPFSWSPDGSSPEVSLLDPVNAHVLATLQALPDTPASLFAPPPHPAAPPTGGNWITTTPDGYFEGSANVAPFIRWNVDGVLYPASAYWDVYYRPDLVQQVLHIPEE